MIRQERLDQAAIRTRLIIMPARAVKPEFDTYGSVPASVKKALLQALAPDVLPPERTYPMTDSELDALLLAGAKILPSSKVVFRTKGEIMQSALRSHAALGHPLQNAKGIDDLIKAAARQLSSNQ